MITAGIASAAIAVLMLVLAVLLAMMVLAMKRLPSLRMPPPPEKKSWPMVGSSSRYRLQMSPQPSLRPLLCEMPL